MIVSREIILPGIDRLFFLVEYLGVLVGALGGALSAIRDPKYKYDVVGVLGLAMASALGGGIIRDIILQNGPPLAFLNIWYLITAIFGASVAIHFGHQMGDGAETAMVIIDAAALGLFAVAGTTRALNVGLRALPAILLGITTAVGGGSLRDVLSGRGPRVFERGQLYAIAALAGCSVFLISDYLHMPREFSSAVATSTTFILRVLAWRFDWRTSPIEFKQPS